MKLHRRNKAISKFIQRTVGRISAMIAVTMYLLVLLSSPTVHAQRMKDPEIHILLKRGIELSGRQQYSQAAEIFDRIIALKPNHPAGYLNKAVLLQVMSLDFETPVPHLEFLELLDRADSLAEADLRRNERNAEANYYKGMTESYYAYYQFRDGENWLSGLSSGMAANGYLEICLEMDPGAYDSMTGVGTYRYWKSRNMSFLTWTPFVDDERRAGINLLRIAERKAEYSAAQATNSLIWIYIEEERYGESISSAKRILKRYPNNRLFLWGLASAAEKKGDWTLALSAYQRIIRSIDSEVLESRYIEIQARSKVAWMSYKSGDLKLAKKACDWVLAQKGMDLTPFTDDGKDRIERRIEECEELREEMQQ